MVGGVIIIVIATVTMWSQRATLKSVLSIHPLGARDSTQAIKVEQQVLLLTLTESAHWPISF